MSEYLVLNYKEKFIKKYKKYLILEISYTLVGKVTLYTSNNQNKYNPIHIP